jgi:hypothetical protein
MNDSESSARELAIFKKLSDAAKAKKLQQAEEAFTESQKENH